MHVPQIILIVVMAAAPAVVAADSAQAGVLAFWEFNDLAPGEASWNGQRLVDSAGDRDAFFSKASTFEVGSPDYGNTSAVRLAESDDQIAFRAEYNAWLDADGQSIPDPPAGSDIDFEAEDSFTIEAVIKTSQSSGSGMIASKDHAGTTEWWWRIRDGALEGFVRGETTDFGKVTGATFVADDQWHHVAFVRDAAGDELRLYVDHVLDQTAADASFGTLANDNDIRIGRTNTNLYDLVGDIDFLRISDAALAPGEMIQPGAGLEGDLNGDGFVGGDDLDIVRSFWGQTVPSGDLLSGDPSEDGFVGGDDLDIVRAHWGQGAPPVPTAVPEPNTIVMMLMGSMSMGWLVRQLFQGKRT